MTEGIELPNEQKITNTWEYSKRIPSKPADMKKCTSEKQENYRKTKRYNRNLMTKINTWVIPPCKILGTIFKVNKGRNATN